MSERLDIYLAAKYPAYSRARIQRLIEAGNASINGAIVTLSKKAVLETDTVSFIEPEADPEFPPVAHIPLTIVFEDEAMLVIDKPVGMVVHPNDFHDSDTVVQAVLAIRPEVKDALYDLENPVSRLRPGIVHRLDKDTSGLLVIAKTREAMLALAQQFHDHTIEKTYLTTLYGTLPARRTVDAPIQRKSGRDNVMVASHEGGQGRNAISHFEPVRTYAPYEKWPDELVTECRVHIETGRTHQIRVHAKFIGHPVMGDQMYGNKPSIKLSEKAGWGTQQLRAVELTLNHPTTGKRLTFKVE
jgi:23S rRNA pseudouridine1911/1915/1917 synthase